MNNIDRRHRESLQIDSIRFGLALDERIHTRRSLTDPYRTYRTLEKLSQVLRSTRFHAATLPLQEAAWNSPYTSSSRW